MAFTRRTLENKTIFRYHTARRYRICSFKAKTTIQKILIGKIFSLSDVSDFTWKDSFYFNGILFTQLLVDLFCAKYVDRIGYRRSVVASEIFSAAGLIGLAFFAKSSSRSLCWHYDQCNHLRNGKWSHRSSCQPYCRSVSI